MNTRCPRCWTVFRIEQRQLDAAGGRVRCGQCDAIFDARRHLQKELPLHDPHAPGAVGAGQASLEFGRPRAAVAGLLMSDLGDGESARPSRSGWSLAGWAVLNMLLVALLLAQLVHAQRESFAQDPAVRPLLIRMCELAGCTLPPRRAIDQIELVRRSVYSHPNLEDALIIDATFVNNAPFAQPHPVLTISLGDVHGQPLIRRNFRPREYLPQLDSNQRMAPGSPVRITLEVRDPGPEVRTFELDFS